MIYLKGALRERGFLLRLCYYMYEGEMRERICITIERELLEEIEDNRGDVPRSRFIERLMQRGVEVEEEVRVGYA